MRTRAIDILFLILALTAISATAPQLPPSQTNLTDDQIKNILRERIDVAKKSVGIVVGLIDEKGTRIVSYGKPSQDSTQSVNGDSVFEIGSVTKVFTATLLCDMVERGELNLDDPISKFLPATVKAPTRDGKEITLRQLSSQVSGLPRMPGNFAPKDPNNHLAQRRDRRLSLVCRARQENTPRRGHPFQFNERYRRHWPAFARGPIPACEIRRAEIAVRVFAELCVFA
jgi:CubicO group peptidase (beta-lactamase class C family)